MGTPTDPKVIAYFQGILKAVAILTWEPTVRGYKSSQKPNVETTLHYKITKDRKIRDIGGDTKWDRKTPKPQDSVEYHDGKIYHIPDPADDVKMVLNRKHDKVPSKIVEIRASQKGPPGEDAIAWANEMLHKELNISPTFEEHDIRLTARAKVTILAQVRANTREEAINIAMARAQDGKEPSDDRAEDDIEWEVVNPGEHHYEPAQDILVLPQDAPDPDELQDDEEEWDG
jgi:hypothetical protein